MTRNFTIEDIRDIVTVAETAIDPAGAFVVYVRSETIGEERVTSLWRAEAGLQAVRLTRGQTDRAPRILPGGEAIVFLRDVEGVPQLHTLPLGGGEPEVLTTSRDLPFGAGPAVVSPEGGRVAFAATVDRDPGASDAPIVIDRLGFKVDGVGWLGARRRHLFVVDVATAAIRRLTDGEWSAGAPAWSPDGSSLGFTAAIDSASGTDLTSRAWVIRVDDKLPEPRAVGQATGVEGPVVFASNDVLIAVGSARPGVGNASILRLSLCAGEGDVDLTSSLDRNVMPGGPAYPGGAPALTAAGDEIVFCVRDRGWTHLYAVGVDGGAPRPILADAHVVVSGLSVAARAPRAAVVQTTRESFGEVAIIDVHTGDAEVLTALTAHALAGVRLLAAEEREFTISDGTVVHGWLLAAPETSGAAPLLLDIHGGPHNAWSGVADDVHLYQQLLAAKGWRVLMVNPRGSDGYGESFLRGVHQQWGRADRRDFLEPIDQLVEEGLADPERLAVTGYSYGGFSTCELTTRTDRFAAAVAGGLLCDLVPMAAKDDRGYGSFFADMAAGANPVSGHADLLDSSPISRVDRVATPTLVLHGELDDTCPVQQGQEWFSALRVQGVPTRLVVYPGGGHLFIIDGPLTHRMDYHARLVDWVERHTSATPRPGATSPAARSAHYWRTRLDTLRRRHGVVGAQFGLVRLDDRGEPIERTVACSGLLDIRRAAPVTDDALFQIGSITKVWTTILLMQLVDEGALTLDTRVREVLPDFALAEEEVASFVTVRHLLTHTSGIDGDLFTDTGTGDDCVERYVESLRDAGQVHALGAAFSYCNAGFVVAGRIVEVLRGTTWDEALRKHIVEPMGLTHTITLAEDAPRFATAIGHGGYGDDAVPASTWSITRSMGPAGLIVATVGDLLSFAQTALCDGVAPNGTRILSAESAAVMRAEHVDIRPVSVGATGWGLGWFLEEWEGSPVYGHDGGTIGQRAYLRVFPESRLALALLTTGGRADGLYREMFEDAASAIAGSAPPAAFSLGAETAPDPSGTYLSGGTRLTVSQTEGAGARMSFVDLTDIQRTGGEPSEEITELRASNSPGAWAWTSPSLAGWSQLRPVAGGVYLGYRRIPVMDGTGDE